MPVMSFWILVKLLQIYISQAENVFSIVRGHLFSPCYSRLRSLYIYIDVFLIPAIIMHTPGIVGIHWENFCPKGLIRDHFFLYSMHYNTVHWNTAKYVCT